MTPETICYGCANEIADLRLHREPELRDPWGTTHYEGRCDVCGKVKPVCAWRDYVWPEGFEP